MEPSAAVTLVPGPTSCVSTGFWPLPSAKPKIMIINSGISLHAVETTCMTPAVREPRTLTATMTTMVPTAMGSANCWPTSMPSSSPTFTP